MLIPDKIPSFKIYDPEKLSDNESRSADFLEFANDFRQTHPKVRKLINCKPSKSHTSLRAK